MTDNSPHLDHLKKMYGFFENCTFVGCYRSPPSKEDWIWTIKGVLRLYNNLKIKGLCTGHLQQDFLENLFGTIRGNCGSNYNPTSGQFVAGLKMAILSNLAHLGSGNCKMDDCSSMSDYKEFLTTTSPTGTCTESESPLVSDMLSFESLGNKCQLCNLILKVKCTYYILLYTFMDFKEYDNAKKLLNYVSEEFIRCVDNCATICNNLYETLSYSLNLNSN